MLYKKKYSFIKKIRKSLNIQSKDDITSLKSTVKWILKLSKPIIPYMITITIINSFLALIGVYNALVSKSLIDCAISHNTSGVIKWLIVMATIMLGKMILSPFTSMMSTKTTNNFNHNLQLKIYEHISYSDWLSLSRFHSVSLLTRINSDVSTISSTILNTLPNLVSLLITFIASVSTLIYFAPSIAVAAIIMGPILIIISKLFGSKLKSLYKLIQEETIKYKSFMQETLQNLMIVKTFCMEKNNIEKLKSIQKNQYDLAMKNVKLSIASGLSLNFSSTLVYFIIFCWGAINISNGTSTYGTFTAMLQLYNNVQGPISSLAHLFPSFVSCIAAAERLIELENLPKEKTLFSSLKELTLKPIITFNNVSFGYKKENPIIKNLNLNINSGEIIGLVGPSGEGKTTLIRLLLSLVYCDKGTIKINNELLNREHRKLISYVPQGNTLFSGPILDNLMYGNPNATREDIIQALKDSCSEEFISSLKDGINTKLGEKGIGISEGQAQRLAIARALLRKKPILILDEVTSSLDVITEKKILFTIKNLKHRPTCIIITHRESALTICNSVYNLSNGALSEVDYKSNLESATH